MMSTDAVYLFPEWFRLLAVIAGFGVAGILAAYIFYNR